ncbi:serine/threonine-protein kinase HT1-like [Asparagus officinalis]|uniref:serine/threonine-protein kinase HT1-like n=1 Tax=Asparagus officinalis TaxID=4686 RepID=UPI00098E2BE7|nr:serine/threonine-protein kinase HT1-like [Asparagus officinalis]
MESRKEEKEMGVETSSGAKEAGLRSRLKGFGSFGSSFGSKDMFFRADKIDLKSLDVQLENQLNKVWNKGKGTSTERPKEEWEIDLSKLEIRYEVARGTYGTVYRGTYDGQDVAVKLLDWGEDGLATDAETAALRASFQTEVAVWHKLDHPNVTKFVGASMGTTDLKIPMKHPTSDGQNHLPARACCVVVEYLTGGTLKKYLIKNRRKKLTYKNVIQLALDLARGLSYLHSRKIVHRDVKTENMLLDYPNRTLKIADFGVARVEAQNPKDMTGETGTLGYMAPEVLDGKPYNRKCDVYSFGICLWEIYCCDMPYPDLSFADVSSAVVRQNLRPDIPRCCPSALANIMRRCWDANPDKRPDMDEVVKLLEAIDTDKGRGMIAEDEKVRCCPMFFSSKGR